jgi:hypothetical protein
MSNDLHGYDDHKARYSCKLVPTGRIESVYHTICQATVIGQFLSVAEFYHRTFGSVSILNVIHRQTSTLLLSAK